MRARVHGWCDPGAASASGHSSCLWLSAAVMCVERNSIDQRHATSWSTGYAEADAKKVPHLGGFRVKDPEVSCVHGFGQDTQHASTGMPRYGADRAMHCRQSVYNVITVSRAAVWWSTNSNQTTHSKRLRTLIDRRRDLHLTLQPMHWTC